MWQTLLNDLRLIAPPSRNTAPHTKKGFNLVEAVIVLGIIGLVMGGIWVTASAVRESYRINETAQGIIAIAQNAQTLLNGYGFPATPNATTYSSAPTGIMAAVNNGIFPIDAPNNAFATPYGYISMALRSDASGQPLDINFILYGFRLRPYTCNRLIAAIMNTVKDRNMLQFIYVDGAPPFADTAVHANAYDFNTFSCPQEIINIQLSFSPRP